MTEAFNGKCVRMGKARSRYTYLQQLQVLYPIFLPPSLSTYVTTHLLTYLSTSIIISLTHLPTITGSIGLLDLPSLLPFLGLLLSLQCDRRSSSR